MPQPKRERRAQSHAECFLLCDFVQVAGGKLNILGGGWDRFDPTRLPWPHSFYLAIKLSVPPVLAGKAISIRIDLTDPEGRHMEPAPLDARIALDPAPDSAARKDMSLMIPMRVEITLESPGSYTFLLSVEDQVIAQTGFQVTNPRLIVGPLGPKQPISSVS